MSLMAYSQSTLADVYRLNLKTDLGCIIRGIDFFRCLEYPLAIQKAKLKKGCKVLDVGSGKSILPLYLAFRGCNVTAIDIDKNSIKYQRKIAKKAGLSHLLKIELQDASHLSYPNNFFDRIICISTLEHIPLNGDQKAICCLSRILANNGLLVLTLPYGNKYEETGFWNFTRIYDDASIKEQLISPSGLRLEDVVYFGANHFFSHVWYHKLFTSIRWGFGWASSFASSIFLKIYGSEERRKAEGVCLVLRKPENGRIRKYENDSNVRT